MSTVKPLHYHLRTDSFILINE